MTDRRRTAVRGSSTTRLFLVLAGLVAACGSSGGASSTPTIPRALALEARPIGEGARFHPPADGPVFGACDGRIGPRFGAHVEVFAANRVVLIPVGIGTLPPRTSSAGRIVSARCYGRLVTLDPTGLVLVRRGARVSLADLFRSWGEPLSALRVASFPTRAGHQVVVFVDGRRWQGPPGSVPLVQHAEIVVEVGPHVPPHTSYAFPPGT